LSAAVVAAVAGAGTASAASVVTTHAKAKVARVKSGTTWTLEIGTGCESDSFGTRHRFSDVSASGDAGTYKGSKVLRMTWTAGATAGATFKGTFVKANDDYAGPYVIGGQSQPATLVPAATAGCEALTTAPETLSITLGHSDIDTATVTGGGGVTPTGTIHFYVCAGDTTPCTANAAVDNLGTGALAGSSGNATTTSLPYTPTSTGTYCFLAVYSGDSHYGVLSDSSTTSECFTVTPDVAGMATQPTSASVTLGAADSDTATVSGVGGVTPTGTVHFYECKGGTTPCTTSRAANGGTDLGSLALTASASPATATATSAPFTASAAGTYCFLGVYSGDTNYGSTSDASTSDECFTVTADSTGVTAKPSRSPAIYEQPITDDATVTGANGLTPTGSVTYYICGPETTVELVPCSAATGTPVGSPVTISGTGDTATASSASFTPTTDGEDYCFFAVYSGDGTYPSASDGSTSDQCFSVVTPP
jgi:hypothetical protein